MVKFKPRHKKETAYVPYAAKQNRLYEDYLAFIETNPDVSVIQFDTVIGNIGGKVILTIHFINWDFMTGILLDNKTAAEAASRISEFKNKLKCASLFQSKPISSLFFCEIFMTLHFLILLLH